MMEDEKVAKSFLSAIIKEEVVELDFASQEHTLRSSKESKKQEETEETFLTVCRFDFSAKISLPDGSYKTVMIELQKAKLPSDIMRFRRYLGLHYKDSSNTYVSENNKKACQIYCIFLLGNDISIPGSPIVRVDYKVKDDTTEEELEVTDNEFIQGLHHRSWIVQIDQLKQRRRNDVEKLLSIFDQENRTKDHHIMNVDENSFPEIYRPIIRRLRMAYENENIQTEMEMEDDFIQDFMNQERHIAHLGKALEEKDKALEEERKALEEERKASAEKNKVIEELKKQLAEIQKQI
jgi:hypothetical protein